MSTQQLIELCTTKDGKERKYVGRFLGFIKDDEFNALVQHTDQVSVRLESKATLSIMDAAAKFDNMAGHRLIMTVRKINDENVEKKTLYITEGLTMIDSVFPGNLIDPGKVTFQVGENENIVVQETE